MMENYDDTFPPERVDEQIEQLKQALYQPQGGRSPMLPGAYVVQNLHDLHATNEEDQRSVQRVWGRILEEASRDERIKADQHLFLLASQKKKTKSRDGSPDLLVVVPRRKLVSTLNVLVACVLLAMLLGSSIVLFRLTIHPTSTITGSRPTAGPATVTTPIALGTTIGKISLGMRLTTVQTLMGPNIYSGEANGYLYLDNQKGLIVRLNPFLDQSQGVVSAANQQKNSIAPALVYIVDQIILNSPFLGSTKEGFRLGMSRMEFKQIYEQFPLSKDLLYAALAALNQKNGWSNLCVSDSKGTVICADFNNTSDNGSRAVKIVIQQVFALATPTTPMK